MNLLKRNEEIERDIQDYDTPRKEDNWYIDTKLKEYEKEYKQNGFIHGIKLT